MKLVVVILWSVAGLLRLLSPVEISRFSYALCWISLMALAIGNLID